MITIITTKKDGCSFFSFKKIFIEVPEFIEKVVKSNPVKKTFYFEQGVMTDEGVPSYKFLNKIKESPTNEIIKKKLNANIKNMFLCGIRVRYRY